MNIRGSNKTAEPSDNPVITLREMKHERFWTSKLIGDLLGEPVAYALIDGRSVPVYLRRFVLAQESHPDYLAKKATILAAKKARRQEALDQIAAGTFCLLPEFQNLSVQALRDLALSNWARRQGMEIGDVDTARFDFNREIVNILRHVGLPVYHDATRDQEGLGPISRKVYGQVVGAVLLKIAEHYPFLASECLYQARTRNACELTIEAMKATQRSRRRCAPAPSSAVN